MDARILIVDDERPVLELLMEMLEDRGFEVDGVQDGQKAVDAFCARPYELVIADLIMPDMSGLEVIRKIKEMDEAVEVIVLTGYATIDNAIQALRNFRAFDFLTKPLENLNALYNTVEKALERRWLHKENQNLIRALQQSNEDFEQLVSSRTRELKNQNEALRRELAEYKRTEKELRRTKEAAEAASRFKSDFIANMSHEFKNPLNSILGFTEVLMEKYFGPLTEKQEHYVKDIHRSGQHLLMLINETLDFTSFDDEKKSLVISPVNIGDMLESSLNFIRRKALKHDIRINCSVADDINKLGLKIDRKKMKQVLFSLLSRALKSAPEGGEIKIEAWRIKDGEKDSIAVSVVGKGVEDEHDSGPGASSEWSLCKCLVEIQGGTVATEAGGPDKGNRFTVELPLGSLL